MNLNMKYLRMWMLLLTFSHCVGASVTRKALVTKHLQIHCRVDRYQLTIGNTTNYVTWWYRKPWETREKDWKEVATGYFDQLAYIDGTWRNRASVQMTKESSGNNRWTIDSILIINNPEDARDSGSYECQYLISQSGKPTAILKPFVVKVLDVQFSPTSRQQTIEEGRTLSITATMPAGSGHSGRSGATGMRWIFPNDKGQQTGLKLTVEKIQEGQRGIYNFYYDVGDDVDFSELFHITVKPRPSTKSTTTTSTTTTTKSTTNITQPPMSKAPSPTTKITPTPPIRKTVPTANVTLPPTTTHSQISSSNPSHRTLIVATNKVKNVTISPNTTSNISTFTSTPDQNDSVTPALHISEAKNIETPTLLGIIFGVVLGTIILTVILLFILGRKGKLPHFCRKKTEPQRENSRNILVNNQRESTKANSVYSEIDDPEYTYNKPDLSSHDTTKITPDKKVKTSKQDSSEIRKQPLKSQKNEYHNLAFATGMDNTDGKPSLENGYQGLSFGSDNKQMYEYATDGVEASAPNYFVLEEKQQKTGTSDKAFPFENGSNGLPDGESKTGAYFVLEDVSGFSSPVISSDKKVPPKVAKKNKKGAYSKVAKSVKSNSNPIGSGKLPSEVNSTNVQENSPKKMADLTYSNLDLPATNDYDHINTGLNKMKKSPETNDAVAQYSRVEDTKPQNSDYDKLAIGRRKATPQVDKNEFDCYNRLEFSGKKKPSVSEDGESGDCYNRVEFDRPKALSQVGGDDNEGADCYNRLDFGGTNGVSKVNQEGVGNDYNRLDFVASRDPTNVGRNDGQDCDYYNQAVLSAASQNREGSSDYNRLDFR